jgi:hypothetical protein
MKPPAIIVDIDGTLANIDHRRHLLEGEKRHWSEFFAAMGSDSLNTWCADIIKAMKPNYLVLLVTGRPDNYRLVTESWLRIHRVQHDGLLMRSEGDYRPDSEVKREIYFRDIAPGHNVRFVIDDRAAVVKTWRELGLVCLQCAEGNY